MNIGHILRDPKPEKPCEGCFVWVEEDECLKAGSCQYQGAVFVAVIGFQVLPHVEREGCGDRCWEEI